MIIGIFTKTTLFSLLNQCCLKFVQKHFIYFEDIFIEPLLLLSILYSYIIDVQYCN